MKRILEGAILVMVLSIAPSVTAQANSLSYIPTEEQSEVPQDIYEYAEVIGAEFNICPELLMALAERESCFQVDVENGPCKGLMQVNATTHKQRFVEAGWKSSEWSDPYKNMHVAASYLHDLFEQYEDVGIVLGVYHGERNAVQKGMSGNLSAYTTKILERSAELERIHGK